MNQIKQMAALLCALSLTDAQAETPDQRAVRELEAGVALVLAKQGFDAYATLFHPDYSNWNGGRAPLDRARFLAGVKDWHAGGGHAVAVRMLPISIEVFGDVALSRYRLREDFNDGSSFIGRFTSLTKRDGNRWLLFRTHFETEYRGPTSNAPRLEILPPKKS
jgi:ketosteroid isomerase-like protein